MKTTYVQHPLDAKKRGRNKLHLTAIKRSRQFIKSATIGEGGSYIKGKLETEAKLADNKTILYEEALNGKRQRLN